jgi:spermidine synthase
VELALTVIGGGSVALVFAIEALTGSHMAIAVLAHALVIVIGLLSGAEIPLLIAIRKGDRDRAESTVLGVDYLGAFAGTIAFAFVLYPIAGIVMTAFSIAALNAAVGVWLSTRGEQVEPGRRRTHTALFKVQAFLFFGLAAGMALSGAVEEVLIGWYLGGSV